VRIQLVTPSAAATHHGNRGTAERWARILRELGHTVEEAGEFPGGDVDLLVALHARKSAPAVLAAAAAGVPVVLALTGTDLYPDLATSGVDTAVLEAAELLVVLQPLGIEQLPERLRGRARVVTQSAEAVWEPPEPERDVFEVAVLAHLRAVKDPLLPAAAARLLPADSGVRIDHAGAALDADLGAQALAEARDNPRYRWLGDLPHPEALRLLAGSRVMVHPSRHEGGANVVSEALAAGVPLLASRIPGTVGLLGEEHPGYFPPGDAAALAEAISAAERNAGGYYDALVRASARLLDRVGPEQERASWARLLAELTRHQAPRGAS
jgi:putative glycosyltransferase (TIGR04348 family)